MLIFAKKILQRFQRSRKENGLMGAVWHFFKKNSPIHFSHVYVIDIPVKSCHVEGLWVERFSRKHLVRSEILESLRQARGEDIIREIEKLFLCGSELWLGWLNGSLVGICWSTSGLNRKDYFLSLSQNEGTISSCFIFPELRGRGIYPFMLKTIVNELLQKNQIRRIYIDCKSWNYPSIRGIQKAGFVQIGSALRVVLFGYKRVLYKNFH